MKTDIDRLLLCQLLKQRADQEDRPTLHKSPISSAAYSGALHQLKAQLQVKNKHIKERNKKITVLERVIQQFELSQNQLQIQLAHSRQQNERLRSALSALNQRQRQLRQTDGEKKDESLLLKFKKLEKDVKKIKEAVVQKKSKRRSSCTK